MTTRLFALVALTVALCCTGMACRDADTARDLPPGALQLKGAGATFPAPLYKKWLAEYHKRHPEVLLNYDEVGSGEGMKQFMAGTVDFGASDAAMQDAEMAAVEPWRATGTGAGRQYRPGIQPVGIGW